MIRHCLQHFHSNINQTHACTHSFISFTYAFLLMSSFVIGLDIGENHITASLVRIEQSSDENLSIERDTFYIRSFQNNIKNDPRLIISNWIDCIDDLLQDFNDYYQENETIIGIACSLSNPMNYEEGICQIQSSKSNTYNQFFGINLRLLFQSGLHDLILRWRKNEYSKYYTPPTSLNSTISYPDEQTKSVTVISRPRALLNFSLTSIRIEEIQQSKLSLKKLKDYCGLQDTENIEIIPQHKTSIDHTKNPTPKLSVTKDNFSSKISSVIEQLSEIPISFYNKTTCFAIGESNTIPNKTYKRILVLTLGTNFGSTFLDHGEIILNRHDIPPNGVLSTCLYDDSSIANDYFSTYGLINIYKKILGQSSNISDCYSLAQQAFNGDENAIKTFQIYAQHLGRFLIPYIKSFHPNLLLIGGGIAQAWYLIETELNLILKKSCQIEIYFNLSNEKSICLGAVKQQLPILFKSKNQILRQTNQYLLPVKKINHSNQYDYYPCHEIPIGYIGIGYKELNKKFFRLIKENQILLIDGSIGTYFHEFANQLNKYYQFKTQTRSLIFYNTQVIFQTNKNLIDIKKLNYLKVNLSYPCVIIGSGASFINDTSPLIYIDLPKNEFNYRIDIQKFYFKSNDYSIFNKIKQEVLPRMNFFIDGQRPNCPTWIDGNTFRQALVYISNQPIRFRPCFQIDDHSQNNIQIHKIFTLENGIILSDINNHLLELSSDIFFSAQTNQILDYDIYNKSNHFPIQFYLFNTNDKENIFIQSHMNKENKFYYIIKTKQYSIEKLSINCQDIINSKKSHDFFFIFNQTNYITDKNQIILEISTISSISNKLTDEIKEFSCQPISIKIKENQYEEQQIPTPDFYLYDIQRLIIEANESIELLRSTENRFHLCVLVEGNGIEIEFNYFNNNQEKQKQQYKYMEVFLIPPSITEYRLRPIIKNNENKSQKYILLIVFHKMKSTKLYLN